MIGLTMGLLGTGLVHFLTAAREKVKPEPKLSRIQKALSCCLHISYHRIACYGCYGHRCHENCTRCRGCNCYVTLTTFCDVCFQVDPSFEAPLTEQPLLKSGFTWLLYMALSSNTRWENEAYREQGPSEGKQSSEGALYNTPLISMVYRSLFASLSPSSTIAR